MRINRHWILLTTWPALVSIVQLLRIFFNHLAYPVDLEWMEGGVLNMAHRMFAGLVVYPPLDYGYVPFPYPVGYPVLLGLLGKIFGIDYWLGRTVSVIFTIVAGIVAAREVSLAHGRNSHPLTMGLFAAGTIAAGYPVVDGWYDLARIDSMAMALVVLAAVLLSRSVLTRRGAIAAGLLLAASVLTKQSCAIFVVWLLPFGIIRHRRFALLLSGVAAFGYFLPLGVAQLATNGNYWFYTVTLLSEHAIRVDRMREAWDALMKFAPYAPIVPIFAALLAIRRKLSARSVLWLGITVLAWVSGIISFAKDGGYFNNLLPAVWTTGPSFLMVLGDLIGSGEESDMAFGVRWLCALGWGLLLFLQDYPARAYTVDPARARRAQALNAYVRRLGGRVIAPLFPQLARRNDGGADQIHIEAHNDFVWARRPFVRGYENYLRRVDPDWVIMAGNESTLDVVSRRFVLADRLDPERYDVTTTIGWRVGPHLVFHRRQAPRNARLVFDFEDSLERWKISGNAFSIKTRPVVGQGDVQGRVGRFLDSYPQGLRDAATGRAISPTFEIDRARLRLLVGGGSTRLARVELRIEDRVVASASGADTETMCEIEWDVKQFMGKEGQLAIIDESRLGWGHIALDEVTLHDP